LPGAQLDFSAIPVPVSAVFLKRLSTYIFLDLMLLNGQFHLSDTFFKSFSNPFVFVPSVYGEKFPTAEF
jgi:hypothetical protein